LKKIIVLLPIIFLIFTTSIYAASDRKPSDSVINAFKEKYEGYSFHEVNVVRTNGDTSWGMYAVPPGITTSFYMSGTDLMTSFVGPQEANPRYLVYDGREVSAKYPGGVSFSDIKSYKVDTILGETSLLRGVGLKEIPGQMLATGGTVLPVGLMVFASLLIVGLVGRWRGWFLRF
jgi:hypothetical protein